MGGTRGFRFPFGSDRAEQAGVALFLVMTQRSPNVHPGSNVMWKPFALLMVLRTDNPGCEKITSTPICATHTPAIKRIPNCTNSFFSRSDNVANDRYRDDSSI